MRIATSCIALSVFALASGATAGDTLLWDNDIDSDGFNARAISPPLFPDIRVADDVQVPETAWLVSEFRMTAVEDDGWDPGANAIVTFYSDNGGVPGAVFAEYEGAYTRVATGNQLFDRDEYTYFIEIDPPLLIDEGQKWVGARCPEGGGDGTNYWTTSTGGEHGGTNSYFSLDGGTTWQDSGDGWDQTYEIYGALPEGAPRDAHGLRHFPDGGVSLSVEENGDLVISNIGSSGKDGVSVTLGPSGEGYAGTLSHGALPLGAALAANQVGTVSGTPDLPLGGITALSNLGGQDVNLKASLDGLGASTYTMEIFNGGDLLFTQNSVDPEDDVVTVRAADFTMYTLSNALDPSTENIIMTIAFGAPVTVSPSQGGDVLADRIEFTPEGGTAGLEAVTEVDLRFADTGDVAIVAETLRKFALDNAVTGQAKFLADTDGLVISNIGSTGDDGLSQALPNVASLDATLAPIGVPGNGSRILLTSLGGGTQSEIGTAGLWNVGGLTGFPASYAGAGATEVLVEVYSGGEFQGSHVNANSPLRVALILALPEQPQPLLNGAGLLDDANGGPGTYFTFDSVGEVTDPVGNTIAEGDEVRITAVLGGAGATLVTQLDWGFRSVSSPTITSLEYTTGEGSECTPAPDGDVNFDGFTDFDDILVVLAQWGNDGSDGGDGDCNGSVDFDDLLLVLAGWSGKGECN